jgi:aminopeptidase N
VIVRPALVLASVLGLVLGGSSSAQPAAAERAPAAGAEGIGDPYFPDDGNGGIDVQHYDVRDSYSFGSGRLAGRTRLDVRATQDLSRFDLDFLLPVRSVTVDGRRADFQLRGDHELRITPDTALASGSQFRVSVTYAGVPAGVRSHGRSNWLADDNEVVAMNEPHMATWWFPANDHPRDKASFDIRVTVPRHEDVIANGILVSKHERHGRTTAHWRATQPMATYLAFFAAGSFAVSRGRCLGVPNIFALSRDAGQNAPTKAARELGRQTCQIVTQLSGVLGPYPFASMGGLATSLPVSFSLENQTRPTYPYLGIQPGLMTHELAHQWFGDLVSVAAWRDIWLNEGFANFIQDYSIELQGGRTMPQWLDQTYESLVDDKDFWELAIDDPGPQRLFDGAVYTRGEMAVQALRQRIGDAAFFGLLRAWLAQHAYGNGSVADFEALATTLSGQDLTAFFDAWLHAGVVPARTADNGLV